MLILYHSIIFILFLSLDHLLKKGYFGALLQSNYLKYILNHRFGYIFLYFIIFVIIFSVLSLLNYFGVYIQLIGTTFELSDLDL